MIKIFKSFIRGRNSEDYTFFMRERTDVIRVHITKTAGTSIGRSFDFNVPNRALGIRKHYFAREIISIVGQKKWDTSFKFAFVRNPYDRMVSMYRFQLRKKKIKSENEGNSFGEWLRLAILETQEKPFSNKQSQVKWLTDSSGKINLDYIGKFESLNADVLTLAEQLNMKIDIIDHVNQTFPIVHYSSYYTPELKNLIEVHYADDLEIFGYTFESDAL